MKRDPSKYLEHVKGFQKKIHRESRLVVDNPNRSSLAHFDAYINMTILGYMSWSALLKMRQVSRFFRVNITDEDYLGPACKRGLDRLIKVCRPSSNPGMSDEECHGRIWKCSCYVSPDNPLHRGYVPSPLAINRQDPDEYCVKSWGVPSGVSNLGWLATTNVLNPIKRCACIASTLVLNKGCSGYFTSHIEGSPDPNPKAYLKRWWVL